VEVRLKTHASCVPTNMKIMLPTKKAGVQPIPGYMVIKPLRRCRSEKRPARAKIATFKMMRKA